VKKLVIGLIGGLVATALSAPLPSAFADEPPGTADRPSADPEEICRLLGLGNRAAELRRIHRLRAIFKEDACAELCRWLGIILITKPGTARQDG